VEKPLCILPKELAGIERCILELREQCPLLMVGFNRRFSATVTRLRELFSEAGPLSISYRFATDLVPLDHWTQNEEVGGGRIIGEACHAIDTCVALTGSAPVRVYAESVAQSGSTEVAEDRVFITLRHENGSVSSISYQAAANRSFPRERIEVNASGRCAVSEDWDSLRVWANGWKRSWSGGRDKGHRTEIREFLKACRAGGSWPISWDQLYGVAEASLLAVQSLREGVPQVCGQRTRAPEAV
jgi:predicted dehydrogenase